MARDLFNRYIWLVDTIRRYGHITRAELNECWMRSKYSDGASELPRRTFCNYRAAAEELFGIEIKCNPVTFEYYIEEVGDGHSDSVNDWLLNSAVTNEVLAGSRDVAARIFVENVPSAREFLGSVIDAMRHNTRVNFDYKSYTRSLPTTGIVFEPYALKIFRQRWYMVGRNVAENRLKTYALDRITRLNITTEAFVDDPSFDATEYFSYSFGIVADEGDVKSIDLKVEPVQAKYFRTLPLHHSQEEFVHDRYSVFRYHMRLTRDFVSELLSYGPRVEVLAPPELRLMVMEQLRLTLNLYGDEKLR
ncbi:MAG: WYL domain-containing protein [Muribaculaceae bacterium]|jgi:hypothetical protein|nr:WYL domain-containing protein [Muribaculaceae bacterium]